MTEKYVKHKNNLNYKMYRNKSNKDVQESQKTILI